MKNFDFIPVWGAMNTPLEVEVKNFWTLNKAMAPEMAEERAAYAAIIVRNERGELVGVSTAKRVQLKLLNNHYFFEVRCFIAEDKRQMGFETSLMIETKKSLHAHRLAAGKDTLGLVVVVENEKLRKWTKAFWPGVDYYFVGFTSGGHHVRVSYFEDALI